MNITAVSQQAQATESIQRVNEMLKNIINTEMNLEDKMMKVNVTENVSDITGIGKNIDVEA